MIEVRAALPGVAAGAFLGIGGLLVLGVVNVRVPWLDAEFNAAQVRGHWVTGLLAAAITFIAATVVVCFPGLRFAGRGGQRAPVGAALAPPLVRAIVCIAACAAAIWLVPFVSSQPGRVLAYHGFVLTVIVTVAGLVTVLLVGLGDRVHAWGQRFGAAGAIVGGRRLQLMTTRTARLTAGVAVVILTFGQVQLDVGLQTAIYRQAVAGRDTFGDTVVQAGRLANTSGTKQFIARLPANAAPVWTWDGVDERGGASDAPIRYRISGSCQDLGAVGLRCGTTVGVAEFSTKPLAALRAGAGIPANAEVRVLRTTAAEELRHGRATLNLVSTTGRDLPVQELQASANHLVVGGLGLASVGETWIAAGTVPLMNQRWISLWALWGLLGLVAVTAIVLATDTRDSARSTAPLAALTDRRGWLAGLSGLVVAVPLVVAAAVAALIYLATPSGINAMSNTPTYYRPSTGFALGAVLVCLLLGGIMSLVNFRASARAGQAWSPGSKASL
ncbi:MAG: hypothetical protein QM714_03275 [Nocardioides sp.]|uniref:hypothetical protein n=1 Tax=Nocardioides sp. TaxID=35761 RepID=UPI0039E6D2A3